MSKQVIKTDEFKLKLQEFYSKKFGVKVSKVVAWEAFKETMNLPLDILKEAIVPEDFRVEEVNGRLQKFGEKEISLAGVAKFCIKLSGNVETMKPKYKIYPSSKIDKELVAFVNGDVEPVAEAVVEPVAESVVETEAVIEPETVVEPVAETPVNTVEEKAPLAPLEPVVEEKEEEKEEEKQDTDVQFATFI